MDWIRLLLPGVFVEVSHWRDRARRAESQVEKIIEQYSTVIAHEREVHAAERAELLSMLAGKPSQKPPQSAEQDGEVLGNNSFSSPFYANPIQRAIAQVRAELAEPVPDELIASAVDDLLRHNAVM